MVSELDSRTEGQFGMLMVSKLLYDIVKYQGRVVFPVTLSYNSSDDVRCSF